MLLSRRPPTEDRGTASEGQGPPTRNRSRNRPGFGRRKPSGWEDRNGWPQAFPRIFWQVFSRFLIADRVGHRRILRAFWVPPAGIFHFSGHFWTFSGHFLDFAVLGIF